MWVCSKPQDWVAAIHKVSVEPDWSARMGQRARAWVESYHRWSIAGAKLAKLVETIEGDARPDMSHGASRRQSATHPSASPALTGSSVFDATPADDAKAGEPTLHRIRPAAAKAVKTRGKSKKSRRRAA